MQARLGEIQQITEVSVNWQGASDSGSKTISTKVKSRPCDESLMMNLELPSDQQRTPDLGVSHYKQGEHVPADEQNELMFKTPAKSGLTRTTLYRKDTGTEPGIASLESPNTSPDPTVDHTGPHSAINQAVTENKE